MQMKTSLFLLALIVAPCRSMAADVENSSALEECAAFSQAGMRECLAKKSNESAAALKQAERKAATVLSKWDDDAKYIALATERLKASDTAFERYRDAQCAFAASLGGGSIGNALEIRRLACIVDLNRVRAESISATVMILPLR